MSESAELLEREGSRVSFSDRSELETTLSDVATAVPRRTDRRRTWHRERYCLALYLKALSAHDRLDLPLEVTKSEAPDYFLRASGCTAALEVTEVGTERHQQAMTELERRPPGTALEGERSLRAPDEPLQDDGYVGNEPERALAELLLQRMRAKLATLNGQHFAEADQYDLLLYDNSHVFLSRLGDAADILRQLISDDTSTDTKHRSFSVVTVLRDEELLYNVLGTSELWTIEKN